jgi:diguanylate cyclase (GGDEF)-like protein
MPPIIRRVHDVLLGNDKYLRTRTKQSGLAAVLMLACMAILHMLAITGVADTRSVTLWSVFCVSGLAVFFVLIRSGYSQRWTDPSLTLAQMLYAIACDMVAFVIAGKGAGMALPLLSLILMFGMFGMSMRQVVVVAVYALTLFGIAIGVALVNPTTDEPVAVYAAYFLTVFIVLTGVTCLTWRLGQIRKHMHRQKEQLEQALEKIQLIATRDELTGTANRRSIIQTMRNEMLRSERTTAPLLVAMLDIDYFKRINDGHGHQAGDLALQAFTKAVQASIRGTDTLARWGGEEFLILLNDSDMNEGMACLERVRAAVEAVVVKVENTQIRFTVSIGVTETQTGDSAEKTVDRADLALYAAKSQGRNRIVTA